MGLRLLMLSLHFWIQLVLSPETSRTAELSQDFIALAKLQAGFSWFDLRTEIS
jgi:hypothetical protein